MPDHQALLRSQVIGPQPLVRAKAMSRYSRPRRLDHLITRDGGPSAGQARSYSLDQRRDLRLPRSHDALRRLWKWSFAHRKSMEGSREMGVESSVLLGCFELEEEI